ncbi:hypothetical protein EWM64_g6601, partial [Hericium alpestre]
MPNGHEAQDVTDAQRERDVQDASSHEEREGQDISMLKEREVQDVPSPLIPTRTPHTALPRRTSSVVLRPHRLLRPPGRRPAHPSRREPLRARERGDPRRERVATVIHGPDETTFDLEKLLRGLRKGREEQAIPVRELGVIFRGLRVEVQDTSTALQRTLSTIFDPRSWARALHRPPR